MSGIYNNFAELAESLQENTDYRIIARSIKTQFAIVAPHGGRIEHGTSQIADAIAADTHACYLFEGLQPLSHDLHLSSNAFDEPKSVSLINDVNTVITIHGAYGKTPYVYFGGLHEQLKQVLIERLIEAGFPAEPDPSPTRQGKKPTNICNRGKSGKGVQIEMTQGFRKSLFKKPDYNKTRWLPNEQFHLFVKTIREGLSS